MLSIAAFVVLPGRNKRNNTKEKRDEPYSD